jgi:hypothetical protein
MMSPKTNPSPTCASLAVSSSGHSNVNVVEKPTASAVKVGEQDRGGSHGEAESCGLDSWVAGATCCDDGYRRGPS